MTACSLAAAKPTADTSRATCAHWCARTCCACSRSFANVQLEYAWGGTLAVTPTRLPFVRRLAPGLYNASGFSGLGVVLAPFTGRVMAEAMLGDEAALALLEQLPVPTFPGGALMRRPAVIAALSWCALIDRF